MLKKDKGFTLLELMIVVAIVSILAAIAYPSYQQHILKARRTDAKEALLSIAGLQERYFLQHNKYATAADNVWHSLSSEKYYALSKADGTFRPDACKGANDTNRCYVIQAVPAASSPQNKDEDCATFTIDNAGRKLAYNKSNSLNNECW
ncbi:Fimbrial protein [Thalassocella blandensis]|nr:Fimbrial protein [Thalassocella blandensis]